DPTSKRPLFLRAQSSKMNDARVLALGSGPHPFSFQAERVAERPPHRPSGLAGREGVQAEVLDVLLTSAEGLEADRGDRLTASGGGIEECKRVGLAPGCGGAHGLPGKHPVASQGP